MKGTEQYFPLPQFIMFKVVVTLNVTNFSLSPFITLPFSHRNTRVLHTDPMPLQDTVPIMPWPSRSSCDCCLENTGEVLSLPGPLGAPGTSRPFAV